MYNLKKNSIQINFFNLIIPIILHNTLDIKIDFSSISFFNIDKMASTDKKYRTYIVRSWHWYQRVTPGSEHTIEKYNKSCENDAQTIYEKDIMVLRDNITEIKGYYYYSNGFPIQNLADSDGYVDVRTGKYYKYIEQIFVDIN